MLNAMLLTGGRAGLGETEEMGFGWLDLLMFGLALFGAVRGIKRGLIREGIAMAGLVLGFWMAAHWHGAVEEVLAPLMGDGPLVETLAYLLVVLAILICATLATVWVYRLRWSLALGGLDRVGGAALGAMQGGLVGLLVVVIILRFPVFGLEKSVYEARIPAAALESVSRVLVHFPPELAAIGELFYAPARAQ